MRDVEHKHTPIWDGVFIFFFSTLLGCPIGGIFFAFSFFAVSLFSENPSDFGKMLASLPLFIFFSYKIGFVFALSSSIGIAIYAWIFKKLTALTVLVITVVMVTLVIGYFIGSYKELISKSGLVASFFIWPCSLIAAYFSYRLYYNGLSISKLHLAFDEQEGLQ